MSIPSSCMHWATHSLSLSPSVSQAVLWCWQDQRPQSYRDMGGTDSWWHQSMHWHRLCCQFDYHRSLSFISADESWNKHADSSIQIISTLNVLCFHYNEWLNSDHCLCFLIGVPKSKTNAADLNPVTPNLSAVHRSLLLTFHMTIVLQIHVHNATLGESYK